MKELINCVLVGQMSEATEQFNSLLSDKISTKLSETKIAVAQNLFGGQLDEAGGWRGHSQAKKADARKAFDNLSDEELNKQILGRHRSLTAQEGAKALEVHHLTGQDEYWNRIKKFHESVELDSYSMEELLDFVVSEDFDRLDELSKKTLGSYMNKAGIDMAMTRNKTSGSVHLGTKAKSDNEKQIAKRDKNVELAISKYVTKESFELDNYSMEELLDFVVSEDFDRLDELSKKTLGSYIRKASSDRAHSTRSAGVEMSGGGPKRRENIDKHEFHAEKRAVGISKAVDKLTQESIELDEARKPSFIAGTRKIASFDGDGGHTAEVRYSPEYSEYQVHHYKNGEHQGEGPISYHGDDKEDAMSNAKHETSC